MSNDSGTLSDEAKQVLLDLNRLVGSDEVGERSWYREILDTLVRASALVVLTVIPN